jgi:ubiquinol-cytochrome c reductase iron-sulfur subunit
MVAAAAMTVGFIGFIGFGVAYWEAASTQWEAITLGIGLFGLGFGVTAWGKYLMPQGPFVEERHEFHSTEAERDAMTAAITERGGMVVQRRKLLGGLFALGSAAMGVVLLFPLLRSLGPKPGTTLFQTNWRKGSQLVTIDGREVHADDLEVGGVLTVFPKGFEGSSPNQVILLRLSNSLQPLTPPGRTSWGVEGYIAYSKLCTHLGCPVGLYQEQTQQLVCPCHQSIFNVLAGALPEFGPAPRPLPQLPITADASGHLRANGGFDQAVGPGFFRWLDDRLGGQGRPHHARQDLPRPLVVPARGDRPLLLRHPPGHRRLPVALLRPLVGHEVVYHGVYKPLDGKSHVGRLRLVDRPLLRRPQRSRHPPDAPLGGRRLRGGHRRAHGPDLLHRRLPQAPRAQLVHRCHPADPGHRRRVPRLLAARRPGLGDRYPHRLLDHPVHPVVGSYLASSSSAGTSPATG